MLAPGAARASFSTDLERIGTDLATRIVLDPLDFLYDLHLTTEDRTPLPVDRRFQVGTNLFPNLVPFTQFALSGKGRLHREHGSWPQVDLRLGGWYFIGGAIVSSAVKEFTGSLFGYHAGLSAAVTVDPRLRVFGGYEFSQLRANVDIEFDPDSGTNSGTGFDLQNAFSSLHAGRADHFLFVGGEVLRTPVKRLVAEAGWGLVNRKLIARITWASRNFDTGFAFYPEGAWALWPVWNFQVRF
jgi:hypothetical protein